MAALTSGGGALENQAWKAHVAMVMVQLFNGGYHVITKVALNDGVNQFVFCAIRDVLALSILAPAAYILEKRQRPPLTKGLLLSFFLLGLTGIFGNQLLFLLGLNYTNPSYASATQPAIPVFTFMFTVMMGIEKIHLFRVEGQAKVAGTVICVSGAILMVVFRGPTVLGYNEVDIHASNVRDEGVKEHLERFFLNYMEFVLDRWHVGVLCLIGNCMCMATYLAIQVPVLQKYPASLSVTAYAYAFGAFLITVTAFFMTDGATDWILSQTEICAVVYAGLVTSALSYGLITWSNKILGPSLVALYNPLQPAASAYLSYVFLGTAVYLGSIIGGCLIIVGLYLVTWATYRERQITPGATINADVDYKVIQTLIHKDASTNTISEDLFSQGSTSSSKLLE